MKRFLLIGVSALAVNLYSSSWADDATKFPSPDGKFAMLLTEDEKEEGRVKIQLIEVELAQSCAGLWLRAGLRTRNIANFSGPRIRNALLSTKRVSEAVTRRFISGMSLGSPNHVCPSWAVAPQRPRRRNSRSRVFINLSKPTRRRRNGSSPALWSS